MVNAGADLGAEADAGVVEVDEGAVCEGYILLPEGWVGSATDGVRNNELEELGGQSEKG